MSKFGVTQNKEMELQARMDACGLRESDLQETYTRSGGPGGQKVNRTDTCVHLKHMPSGVEVKMQQERSQSLNRFFARRRLCELMENQSMGKQSPEALHQEKVRRQKDRRRRRTKTKTIPEGPKIQARESSSDH